MHNLYALSITAVTKWITEISLETTKAVACVAWRFCREHYAKTRANESGALHKNTRESARERFRPDLLAISRPSPA